MPLEMEEVIERIRKRLREEEPPPGSLKRAAVAMILAREDDPSVLLIKRAEREGDPWSGQVALPGGKMADDDRTAAGTAERETLEEVGIDLKRTARFMGYSEATRTHTGTMEVVPCAYILGKEPAVTSNSEVASFAWTSLKEMLSPQAKSTFKVAGQRGFEMPAFSVGGYVVWGLTYRILTTLLEE